MALVTFSDAATIQAADLNNNFQDEESAAKTALPSKSPLVEYRVSRIDIGSGTNEFLRRTIIRPSNYCRIKKCYFYAEDGSFITGDLTATLTCLTDSRIPDVVFAAGGSGSGTWKISYPPSDNEAILVPGFEYKFVLSIDNASTTDFAQATLVCDTNKGKS